MSRTTFGSLPWRSRSQHDLSAKSCPAHNLVIWSQISQLFYIIDYHIDSTVARTRTLLFAVEFYKYFWQTTSLLYSPIPIRGALPGSDRLLFYFKIHKFIITVQEHTNQTTKFSVHEFKWFHSSHVDGHLCLLCRSNCQFMMSITGLAN